MYFYDDVIHIWLQIRLHFFMQLKITLYDISVIPLNVAIDKVIVIGVFSNETIGIFDNIVWST